MYSEYTVLFAEILADLHILLNSLHDWCSDNDMIINCEKSNAFETTSVNITEFVFTYGNVRPIN